MTLPVIIISGPRRPSRRSRHRSGKPRAGSEPRRCRCVSRPRATRWRCPGILTGTIIGMARALGRYRSTADDRNGGVRGRRSGRASRDARRRPCRSRSTCGPTAPERAFVEKTSGAILVLLGFLISHERHRPIVLRASVSRGGGSHGEASADLVQAPEGRRTHDPSRVRDGRAPDVRRQGRRPVRWLRVRMRARDVDVFYGDNHAIQSGSAWRSARTR